MFSKQIIDSDAFLDMPLSSQALYFHLNMRADDDGFINNPKKIQRMVGCGDDELKLLIAKKFVIPFESGVCVIKHWLIHNYIRKDTYKETTYIDEKAELYTKKNRAYTLNEPPSTELLRECNEDVTQYSIEENSKEKIKEDKNNIDKPKKEKKESEFDLLINEYTSNEDLKNNLYEFIKMRKAIKATITGTGLKRILSKLNTLSNNNDNIKIKILDNSIMNSWKGVFELKEDYKEVNKNYGITKQNNKPTTPKTITGEGEELAKRAIEKYGDKLQDFECEF